MAECAASGVVYYDDVGSGEGGDASADEVLGAVDGD